MRIVGGKFKGKRINAPIFNELRPTTDFAKEALFNILSHKIDFENISMLDLFSGSGSISFEAASRGCTQISCVEQHPKKCAFILKTLKELEVEHPLVFTKDVFKFLSNCTQSFDFIFADPPYELKYLERLPDLIIPTILNNDGIFVLEHGKKNDFSKHPNFSELRNYGNVCFSFFVKHTE
ncbi:MAG: RsmD family RNA methyltransferase [Bacteroidia bacterium]